MKQAVPLTELDAVNEILSTGSESPISTLDESETIDASLARRILRTTSVEIQTEGWFFNEESEVPLVPDIKSEIILPRNILRLDAAGADVSLDLIARGTRLYNRTDRTYRFDGSVTVDWILGLDFEELPSSARQYITIRAARKYQDRYFSDPNMHSYTQRDEMQARVNLVEEDNSHRDPNMLSSAFAQQLLRRS